MFIIFVTENYSLPNSFDDTASVQRQPLIKVNCPQRFKFRSYNTDNYFCIYSTKYVNSCVGIWT